MRQRIDLGAGLIALGAVGLLISLFLDWYAPGVSAWDAFEIVDWALAFCALAALTGVGIALRDGIAQPAWLPAVVLAALVLVGSQIIDPPPIVHGHTRETGAWLALASVLLMILSNGLAAASISVTVDVRGRERRRRVAAVDRRDVGTTGREEPAAPPPRPPAASPPPARPPARPPGRDPERTQPLRPLEPRGGPETSDE
jgi:hypothetical protein